ncbi:hypothetical protein BKE30_02705 [Alkanindiges hydrocarboniclasticus]|uniref:Molecular chaperone DnaJ n=1 Tax=Alkanindiges hydrocarboniclasticus TaxID=1907941 RepID=A0A1S8CX51_9GAMM|nr:hypothetical protein [Alkanindiges hydrocarboniclasticus]ONG41767.1 hypothetical protein BKE30_02705 [Alkanindiges hydrocarboniclasticus]
MQNKSAMVATVSDNAPHSLTPQQKKFNQLSEKIEQQKQQLEEWKQTAELAQRQVNGKLAPLFETLTLDRLMLIEQLHEASLAYAFTSREAGQLNALILQWCEQVLDHSLSPVQVQRIELIYEVHAGYNFQGRQAVSELPDERLTPQVHEQPDCTDDVTMADPDDYEAWHEQIVQQRQAEQQARRSRQKNAKQAKNIQQAQHVDALAHKSFKQIYQRLVANLHPDREPDEQEKIKKTGLMQQVTESYQAQDLLGLLQWQIQLGQQDKAGDTQLADEQLQLYNLNLSRHSEQLDQQINEYRLMLQDICQFENLEAVTPKTVIKKLKEDARFILQQHHELQQLIHQLSNAKAIKTFLKQMSYF